MEIDRQMMDRALAAADAGYGRVHPNPLVGAVIAKDGEVIATGHHSHFGGTHAEAAALAAAGERARGATLYLTLEPCAHHGKQPPCVDAVINAGIARVVIAISDPNPLAQGGIGRLRDAGITVDVGVGARRAQQQNVRFLHRFTDAERPWVAIKLAMSIDGMIADAHGDSQWISDEGARAWVQRLRANVGAIGVGARTAIRDHARLTVRGPLLPPTLPARVLFDRSGTLAAGAPILTDGGPQVTVLLGKSAAQGTGAELERVGARVHLVDSLAAGLGALHADGVDSLLVEGGGQLASALLDENLVDRVYLIQAPIWLGHGRPAWQRAAEPAIATAPRWERTAIPVPDSDDLVQMFEPA